MQPQLIIPEICEYLRLEPTDLSVSGGVEGLVLLHSSSLGLGQTPVPQSKNDYHRMYQELKTLFGSALERNKYRIEAHEREKIYRYIELFFQENSAKIEFLLLDNKPKIHQWLSELLVKSEEDYFSLDLKLNENLFNCALYLLSHLLRRRIGERGREATMEYLIHTIFYSRFTDGEYSFNSYLQDKNYGYNLYYGFLKLSQFLDFNHLELKQNNLELLKEQVNLFLNNYWLTFYESEYNLSANHGKSAKEKNFHSHYHYRIPHLILQILSHRILKNEGKIRAYSHELAEHNRLQGVCPPDILRGYQAVLDKCCLELTIAPSNFSNLLDKSIYKI